MRSGSRGSVSVDWADQSGVDGQLGAVEEWEPVSNDLQPPAVQHNNYTQVQVTTLAPASRQMRAAAVSKGNSLRPKMPATEHAAR